MATCETCHNDYDDAFTVVGAGGDTHVYDSWECAAHALAPTCVNCGVRVLGHGVQDESHVFCCAHYARAAGVPGTSDRVSSGS